MTTTRHFQWGYIAQIASILTLAVSNIVLPNLLPLDTFASLTAFYAYIGLTATLFHEGVTLLSLKVILKCEDAERGGFAIAIQAAFEYALVVLVLVCVAASLSSVFLSDDRYATADWLLVLGTALLGAVYAPVIAWLTALHRNDRVALLNLINGGLSVALPLALALAGLDVRWSVGIGFLTVLALCVRFARESGSVWKRPSLSRGRIVCLRPSIISTSAPSMLNIGLVSFPVLVLAAQADSASVAAYKVGLSIVFGIVLLVPFNRRTMLSLARRADPTVVQKLAEAAVLLAAASALLLIALAEPMTRWLYHDEMAVLATLLPALALVVVLQIVADALLIQSLLSESTGSAIVAAFVGLFTLVLAAAWLPPQWIPATTLLAYGCVLAALSRRRFQRGAVPLRSLALGLAVSLIAIASDDPFVAILGLGALAAGTLLSPHLRTASITMVRHLLGRADQN